jgi:hypothetical protein
MSKKLEESMKKTFRSEEQSARAMKKDKKKHTGDGVLDGDRDPNKRIVELVSKLGHEKAFELHGPVARRLYRATALARKGLRLAEEPDQGNKGYSPPPLPPLTPPTGVSHGGSSHQAARTAQSI